MLKFHSLRVAQVQPQAEDAVGVALEVPPELAETYRGAPGQHIVLRMCLGDGDLRRTYSLVNAPGERFLRIVARVHSHGRLSSYFARQLAPGDWIDVLPPNGSFTPLAHRLGQGCCVGFAAGCGITPVLAVARSWLAASATGYVILFYGNRDARHAMCVEELLALKDRYPARLALHFLMTREPQEATIYNGRLDAAKVRELGATFFEPLRVTEYFLCGPGDMIDTVTRSLRDFGVATEDIRAEHFTSAKAAARTLVPRSQRNADEPAASREETAYLAPGMAEVTVLIDGRRRSFTMHRDAESVLEAAEKAGLDLPFSCRAGVCSTCRVKVVQGEVSMAENFALEAAELEQGYVLACQSRVKTPVLELDYDER